MFTDPAVIRTMYPDVNPNVEVAMRVKKAGYLNVPKLGNDSLSFIKR